MLARVCRKYLSFFIAVLILVLQVERSNERKTQFATLLYRSINMSFNPKYIDSLISNVSTDRSAINVALSQIKNVSVDFLMNASVLYKRQASKKYQLKPSFNINMCDLLHNQLKHRTLLYLWIANMLMVMGSYYWRNLHPYVCNIKTFISAGLYRVDTKFYMKVLNIDLFTNITVIFETNRKSNLKKYLYNKFLTNLRKLRVLDSCNGTLCKMNPSNAFLALLWYLSCSEVESKSKLRYLYFRNVSYTYNPNHFTAVNIYTTDEAQAMQIETAVSHNVTKDIWFEFLVSMKPINADKYQKVFNFNFNGCALLKRSSGPGGFDIVKRWAMNLLSSGNTPLSCPVLKSNYSWTVFPSKKHGVHILQMEGFYRMIFNAYMKRSRRIEPVLNTSTTSELIYKYK